VADIPNFHLLGRLAEYQYYNIDVMVEKAMELAEKIN
jgi:UDP-galactopyranose mutase